MREISGSFMNFHVIVGKFCVIREFYGTQKKRPPDGGLWE
jgi:hypothetical protein